MRKSNSRRLFQRGDDRPEAHLLSQTMRSAKLLGIKHRDQGACGDSEAMHRGAVKHNGDNSVTHTVDETT